MSTTEKTTDQLFRIQLPNPDYPLAGRSETLTEKEWKRVYGYFAGCDILAMHNARLVPVAEHTPEKTKLQMPCRTLMESNSLHRGQLVIVDGKWHGEITETMIGDGSFYRAEVDCDKEKHEFWTVKFERMEVLKDVVKIIVPHPKNDADTLMAECLEREAKQRAEIHAMPALACEVCGGAHLAINCPGPRPFAHITLTTPPPIPEHRSTAFVAGLQEARIKALETALRALIEYIQEDHGQGVCDCRHEPENAGHVCAICSARTLLG